MIFVLVAFVILILSGKFVQPLIGQDVMPPMDTGIIKINFEADSNSSLIQANAILSRMETIIQGEKGVVSVSSTLGSEPSVVSFGSGKNPQQGNITVNLVDRFHRKQTMWQIEDDMRRKFLTIPGAEVGGRLRLRRHAALHRSVPRWTSW